MLCGVQEIASLKRQFTELLSDIGFVKEGLKARVIERMAAKGTDGIMEATGREVGCFIEKYVSKKCPLYKSCIAI